MAFTQNYNLKKPEQSEQFDVQHQNSNMDIIDSALAPIANPEQAPTGLSGKLSEWVGWIANRFKAITGKENWYDTPTKTMEALNTDLTALQDEVTAHKADNVTDADGVHGLKISDGTWTPTLAGSSAEGAYTYNTEINIGRYYKIGNLVFACATITVTGVTSAGAGNATIKGLPYNVGGAWPATAAGTGSGSINALSGAAGLTLIGIYGSPAVGMYKSDGTALPISVCNSALPGSIQIGFSIVYYAS